MMFKTIWQKIINFVSKNGIKIGKNDFIVVFRKTKFDGSTVTRAFDKETGELLKVIEKGLKENASIVNINKFYEGVNQTTNIRDFKNNRLISIVQSVINPNPERNFYSPTNETHRLQKRVKDFFGNWISDTEVRSFDNGNMVTVYDKLPNNVAKIREYRQGKLQFRNIPYNPATNRICSSIKI